LGDFFNPPGLHPGLQAFHPSGILYARLRADSIFRKKGKLYWVISSIPRVYTRGYKYFIPPGFWKRDRATAVGGARPIKTRGYKYFIPPGLYDAQIVNLSYEINNQKNSTRICSGLALKNSPLATLFQERGKRVV
jgi:hypothetical protein